MPPSRPISPQQTAALVTRLRNETIPKLTADLARRELGRVQGAHPAAFEQFVDGIRGAPLDSVRPGGTIRFRFVRLGPLLEWIYEQLVRRSPVGPERGEPHYRDVHWLLINGQRVNVLEGAEAIALKPDAFVRYVNARPYARKIERGLSTQAPDGVYELVALEAQRRFQGAVIEFSYLPPGALPVAIPWRSRPYYKYPCITVKAA